MLSPLKSIARRSASIAGLVFLPFAVASNIAAPTPDFGPGALSRIWDDPVTLQASLDEKIALLSSVVIHENVSRYSQAGNAVRRLDTLDTDVEVVEGTEQYSSVRRNSVSLARTGDIRGAWSFGEVVTLLRSTRDALDQHILDARTLTATENGTPVFEMTFNYPSDSHRWYVSVNSRVYWLDFQGKLWLSPQTGEILRISWQSTAAPPAETGIASVLWTVDFRTAEIAGQLCTLPDIGVYRVNHSIGNAWSEWNVTKFSGVGRYGSQVNVRFEP